MRAKIPAACCVGLFLQLTTESAKFGVLTVICQFEKNTLTSYYFIFKYSLIVQSGAAKSGKTFDNVCVTFTNEPIHTAQSCVMGMQNHAICIIVHIQFSLDH